MTTEAECGAHIGSEHYGHDCIEPSGHADDLHRCYCTDVWRDGDTGSTAADDPVIEEWAASAAATRAPDPSDGMTLATRVRALRQRMYATAEEAADHGGLTVERWRAIEGGARPNAGECLSLSWALGVSLDVIRGRGITAHASDEADLYIAATLDTAARLADDGLLPAASGPERSTCGSASQTSPDTSATDEPGPQRVRA